MKINLKVRMKNKVFLLSGAALVVSFFYQIFALCGVVPSVTQNSVIEAISVFLNILAFVGVVADPTTEGLSDSERAMTYLTDVDVRSKEIKKIN